MQTDELIRRLAATPPRSGPHGLERRLAGALGLGFALAATAVVLAWGPRPDLGAQILTAAGVLKFAGGAALALAGWRLASRLARPGRDGVCPVSALLLVAAAGGAAAAVGAPVPAWGAVVTCTGSILVLAAAPLALALAALRRGAPTRPGAAGAAAGLGAGAAGALAYALWCPAAEVAFVALAYGAALGLCAAVGALAGRVWLQW